MRTLVHIEWLKLRTTRAPWFLLLGAVALVAAGVSGVSRTDANLASPDTMSKAAAHVGLVSMLSLVLGIMVMGGEYRHKTITDAFLSTPRRRAAVLAKVIVSAGMGMLFGIVSAATAVLMITVWWKTKGLALNLSNGDLWNTLMGGVAWNVAFAVIGVGVAAMVRNVTAAIALTLAWIAVVEGVVGQLLGDPARWLPFASGSALGKGPTLGSFTPVAQWQGAVALVAYAVLFLGVAVATSVRSDVT